MTTRAAQIEALATPLIDPTTGSICSGYTAYFYAAGTSNAKNVWTEKEKTNPYTSYLLDSGGKILLYGDGIYKIVVKNPSAATVLTLDNQKIQATTYGVRDLSGTSTATPDDDLLICSGTWTLSLQAVANFEHPIDILSLTGTITVDPNSTEQISGASTVAVAAGQRMRIVPDVSGNTWRRVDASYDLNGTEQILDADGDTSITADTDDQIDFKIGGADEFRFKPNEFVQNSVSKKIWKSSPAAAASVTFSGLSAGKIYKLKYFLSTSSSVSLYLTFNDDTGANYYQAQHSHGDSSGSVHAVLQPKSQNQLAISFSSGTLKIGEHIFYGSGNSVLHNGNDFTYINTDSFIKGDWGSLYAGAAGLSSAKVSTSAGTMTGEIWLEEMD